ncbi:MAG: T9SS type A sorting domain-containing protein, partial [Bacteroidetes bacterium]
SVGVDSKVSANVDYTPWFNFAADTDPAVGFQGDYSTLSVSAASPQSGTTMRIQEAFDLVSGSTVNLTNGTYNEIINANKPDVSIIGNVADPAQVVINAGGLGGYGSPLTAIFVSASGISLKGFTLVGGGQAINSNPRYGIKFASVNNSTVEDLIVHDFYRAGIEFLTGSNIAVTDINAYNNGGTGLVVRDIQNAAISNITTDNNTWGGVRVQTSVTGVSGIVFSGINSFGENNQRNGGLYTEEDPPGIPVTYGYTSASQVQLQESDFEYSLLGNQDDPSPRVRFYKTLPQAGAAAIASPAPDHLVLSTAYIRNMVNNELYVEPGMKIQAAVNGAVSDDIIHVASATYSETITFAAGFAKNNLSILGSSPTKPVVNGGVLFQQSGSLSGLMFKDLYFMGAAPQNRVFNMNGITGSLDNFTLDACVIDGENVAGRHGIAGNKIGQAFTVTDCEFKNILGFAVLDMDASSDYSPIGANGLPLTMVTFANNTVENCNGSVAIRGHSTSKTPEVNVYGNNFDNIGGNQSQTGEQWAAMEINHALAANIYNNTIRHVSLGEYGEGQAFQFYDIGTLDMHDNTIMDNYQGIFVFGGGVSDPYGGPYATPGGSIYHNNISSNNQYGISIGSGVTGDPINATMNWWGHASGPLDNKSLPGTPNYNNPTGQGNSVSSLVDYKKWYADDGMTILAPFTITASAGEHGTIDPAGAIEVNYLDSKTFTITSTTDYHIADVLVDGISVGPVKTYNFASVIANHTISASFAINDVVYVSATGNDATGNGTSMYPYQTIGKGVSEVISGGIVNVGAGTFEEQVEIVKPLTLQGTGAGTTFIKSPTTLTKFFATSSNNFPVVYVHGVDNVTVQNLTVDGAGRGNANYRFIGIGYYNAGGTINACDVKDVRNTPIDGSQHGTAIYAYVDNSTSRTVNVSNNTMSGFQKNGMALNGNNLTATVTGNTITGAGAVDFIAQNGIQIGFGATGSITGNTVTGISYTPGTWVSTGILLYTPTGSIITSNNIVNQAQVGIYYLENGGEISDNTITATFAGIGNTSFWGIVADPGGTPRAKPQPFDEAVTANAKQQPKTSTAVIGTLVEGNTLTGDGTNGVALELDALGTETLNVTATNNTITGWAYGVYFYKEAGATLNATVNQNKIASNVVGAFDQTGVLQNAKNNWWGNASGPLDEKTLPGIPDYNNPDGLGNSVTSYVDYNPFYIDEGLTTLSTISISGMKFNDANGNGTKDPEDTGLSGWQITLTGGESPVTTTTDANGNYLFDNLQPRTYTVSEGLQTGWLQTTESPAPATLNPGQHLTNIDFGNFKLITISGMKFNDHDGDGVKDENDEGMAGWTINLSGTVTSSTTTDPTGAYSFTNLGPGTYTVTETVLDGWVQTSTNPTDITSVSGINVTDVNFGNFKKFSISGMKFEDTNGNGMKDGIEAGLSGWTINLTGAATSSTSTDAEGNYSFANLGPGTFTVSEVAQSGWAQSTSNPPNITGASGENVGNILFGNFKDAVISGMKFNDLDGDGVQDEGEAGLAGWTIRATKGASVKNTTTDAQGLYSISFTYSDAGQWTVSEVVQASWRQTYPASGTYSVLIQSGALAPNKTFGNYQLSSISGKKYDDMLGDSAIVDDQGINSWVIKLYQGTQMIGRQVTAGGGNYTFADLDPGTYIVQESLKTNWIQTYPKSGAGIVSPVADNNAGSRAYQIVITSGSAITQKDFANFNLGIISGVKFEDMDGDSVKETGDPLLASWVINLKKNGNVIDSDTTDLAGSYGFTGLTAGTYEVCEELQPDWYQTVPATPCYSFTVVSGSNFTGNIGNFEFGSIAGYKFFDHDSDGVNDSFSDDMMDSLKVVLVGTHTPPETVFTDANGAFLFDPVPADIYTIIEIPRAEWRQTFPANGANHTIQMMSNLDTSGFAFGNFYMPDTTRFRTFMVIDYNKSAAAKGKSNFIKKPNAGNVRDSVYLKLGFGLDTPSDSGYLRIGIQRYDSANFYGWLHYAYYYYRKAASTVGYHAGSVKNYIYNLRLSKPSRVQPKTNYLKFNGEKIAPTFFGNAGNHFTVELTTLKTNVAASDLGITPAGLGDLVFCRESGPDTILNGKTIRQIIACSDSALTFGLRNQDYWPLSKLILLDSVVTRINREFWKPFVKGYTFLTDTVSSSPLVVKGVKPLYKVAYLKRDPSRVTMLTRFAPVIANEETPLEYRLDQNYPNPFNPSTTIEFELAEPAIVSLSIFNVLGQKVATLLDHQEMIEGLQAVEFNAKDFASGVYFYRVDIGSLDSPEQNSFSSVKKMMLIK